MKTKVSIIIVHYRKNEVLFNLLQSIYLFPPQVSFEIVVVDNDEIKSIKKRLVKNFPKVKYVPAPKNPGYGGGSNLGVKNASGEYIFILNPDTVFSKGMLDKLLGFIGFKKNVGVVAPILYNPEGKIYPLQGTKKLTPVAGIFALSFLNKLFPGNPISEDYWMDEADRTKPFEADVVPGSAFLVKKSLFEKLGGFDENFFLYFEETDFCKRVKEAGYKLFILPEAKLTHYWAASTPPGKKIKKIFARSRFYYFRKNFGMIKALVVEFFCRLKWK